ncbi:transposase [Mycoplasma zalophi]|uniref:transposase n=1 Tax=Mycoplasma zalophi TaxID=191287 RepID=UPI001C10F342|nr:transposase [Mycoplasma zalophi]MBU4690828.1 transposase [Mycoplasma zalophi]
MSRHLNIDEWDLVFDAYQQNGMIGALRKMHVISPKTKFAKRENLSERIKKAIKYYNLGMKEKLLTKKGVDRKPSSGRPKKEPDFDWEIFDRNDLIEIAKRYYEITNQKPEKKKTKI